MKLFQLGLTSSSSSPVLPYLNRYMSTAINGSLSPTADDQLQVFGHNIFFVKDDVGYMYYIANGQGGTGYPGGDKDVVFLATKDMLLDNKIYEGWQKYGESDISNAQIIIDVDPTEWDGLQLLSRTAMYDVDDNLFKIWYIATDRDLTDITYVIGYATSVDGINFTKYNSNPIYGAGDVDQGVTGFAICKDNGVYHCLACGNRNVGEYGATYVTSTDGINWVEDTNLKLIGSDVRLVSGLQKVDNYFILTCEAGFNPTQSNRIGGIPTTQMLYKTLDFVTFTKITDLVYKLEPAEAGINGSNFVEYNGKYYYSYTYFKNQIKAGTTTPGANIEGYTSIRLLESNVSPLYAFPEEEVIYPDYILRYYPLFNEPETQLPLERIVGDVPVVTGTLVWDLNRYVLFDTSQRIVYPSYENTLSEFSVKLNIAPNTEEGNRLAVKQQDSWDISLDGGKLRVKIYDSSGILKKDYITLDNVEPPPGLLDIFGEVKVGFTFNFGVLKLAFGAGVDKAVTKTVDDPLTEIVLQNNVEVGANNHLALRSLVFMTNPTEYQWLYEMDL